MASQRYNRAIRCLLRFPHWGKPDSGAELVIGLPPTRPDTAPESEPDSPDLDPRIRPTWLTTPPVAKSTALAAPRITVRGPSGSGRGKIANYTPIRWRTRMDLARRSCALAECDLRSIFLTAIF